MNRHLHSKMTWEQLEKMSQSDYAAIFLHNYYALGGEEAPENLKRAEAQSSLEYQTKQAIEQKEAAERNARLKDQHIEAAHLIFMGHPERMSAEEQQTAGTYAEIGLAVVLPGALDRLMGRIGVALSRLEQLAGRTPRVRLLWAKQGKHIPGHKNYQPAKSKLTHADPQGLLDEFAGSGKPANTVRRGQPGFKERVDFEEIIGEVNGKPTTKGIIHYSNDGAHIVPANP